MTVAGVGIDLVEIGRVERMLELYPERAVAKLLTADEWAYCRSQAKPAQHVAVRLAAKEAAFKALQRAPGASSVSWLHIEVEIHESGRPELRFHGPARDAADALALGDVLVSLSHSRETATAIVVLSGSPSGSAG